MKGLIISCIMDTERRARRTNLKTHRRASANEMEPPSCAERYAVPTHNILTVGDVA